MRGRFWSCLAVGLLWLAGCCLAHAQPASNSHLSAEIGLGSEQQSSPLVRISPQGNLVYLSGLNRLHGTYVRAQAEGFGDVALGGGRSLSLAADASVRTAPQNHDFDFLSLSAQPAMHWAMPGYALGLGLNLQRMDVARQPFRQVRGLQADITVPQGENHWSMMVESSRWRHPGDLADLDAEAHTLMLQRHVDRPIAALDGLDLVLMTARERNQKGFTELSNRNLSLQATIKWKAWGGQWALGGSVLRARFDDSAFPDEPARRDRGTSLDISVRWPIGPSRSMRLEYNRGWNRSSTHLYDNDYQQLGCVMQFDW